ncbi:MAG TPA: xanthine dehydrogenase family protein molybdopterin-binding subunit [Bryobacteraceae bacterium]|nr:xanthine dehydrogenase family protein molybdopterin-binding subunit [Bryobacteraceae bacterium]
MANTPDYAWPPMEKRKVIGTSPKRLDGPAKSTGRAKYSSDFKIKGMLFGAYVTSPHAHARITAIDTSAAEKTPGVKAVFVAADPGSEVQWQGFEVAAVAATTEEIAREAARKVKVTYEVLPHFVEDAKLEKAGTRGKAAGEKLTGDPDKAFQEAEVVCEGHYGIPVVYHSCLEPHGQVIQWIKGAAADGSQDVVNVWPSVQFVSGYAGSLAPNIKVPAANIKVKMDYIGGGFGSKFGPDAWAVVGANLSKKAGGAPVKLFLDRATEQMIAGNRPSAYANIKVAGSKDGTISAYQVSSWGTGGLATVGGPPQPYIWDNIPNKRINHTSISVNAGTQRAWRAPNNQQAAYLTWAAVDDWAAKAGLDPLEVFLKNSQYAPEARVETYRYQLQKAAEIAEWKKLWKPRGQNGSGHIKRGLGIAMNAWGGGGHASTCRAVINPDGSVSIEIGTQDLGTGTRTIITQVAAETLGLPMSHIKLVIGSNDLPPDGASGGSTTVGGVSASTRKATVNALAKLFEVAAPALGAQPEDLEAVDRHVRVKSNPNKSMTWEAACRKMGTSKISAEGVNDQRLGAREGLQTSGAAGVQIADVSVDTETGLVKMNRFVAVQDCGLIINPRLAESQIYGAIIMGIGTALYEERIMDAATGRVLNPDLEFYKLAGIADIGNIVVHLDIRPENDKRGVIGLGEPPAIGICAAVGNAVANAIGVRVPHIPMTPMHVLNALEGRNA